MVLAPHTSICRCRVCHGNELLTVHDFGVVPLADKLQTNPTDPVPSAPLSLVWCRECTHLQIAENLPPELLFNDHYPYYSSKIPEVSEHFEETYRCALKEHRIKPDDVVLEIASNDGVLLRHFTKHTAYVFGVEPSCEHALLTERLGIETFNLFFTEENSKIILQRIHQKASVKPTLILANNVLAHVPDPTDFVRGLAKILAPQGLLVIEVPYNLHIIRNYKFDVVFHQHFSFFNLHSLQRLLSEAKLGIVRLDRIETQGGSFRLYVRHRANGDDSVNRMLKEEQEAGLHLAETYNVFSAGIERAKRTVLEGLTQIKETGGRIVGYGAPGKAATMLNYFGIDHTLLDYLVDISDTKQGRYFPYTGLKILHPQVLYENPPNYILILAWNYVDSILLTLGHLREKGVRFLVPYPVLKEV